MMRCLNSLIVLGVVFCISSAQAAVLTVATFNTWGVPITVWDTWRYGEAMTAFEKMSPDIILLQEVFTKRGKGDFQSSLYPYSARGPGSLPRLTGSGLKILSKYPIEKIATLVYRSCQSDDCLSRKGALLTVIALPNGHKLNVVATHLNARGPDSTRIDQLVQLKDFIDYYSDPSAPLMLAGDFNFNPESAGYTAVAQKLTEMQRGQFVDLWPATQAASNPGYTIDANVNQYAHDYAVRTHSPLTTERIDYQFTNLIPLSSHLIFNEKPFYSDHYGLVGEYVIP